MICYFVALHLYITDMHDTSTSPVCI